MNQKKSNAGKSLFFIDEDDLPIGTVLSRRDALKLLAGMSGTVFLSACIGGEETAVSNNSPSSTASQPATGCVVRPQLAEGPLFVEDDLNRSDIRTDPSNDVVSAGPFFDLTIRISALGNEACTPLEGARVDLWHCDANGIYSDTSQLGMNTVGQKFLRGHQFTNSQGEVNFKTIYPGWYEGRAVHFHIKIRTNDGYDFTSQLFFDEAFTDGVFATEPYSQRGERRVRNEDDGIYLNSDGQMMLNVSETAEGYAASFDVALDLT